MNSYSGGCQCGAIRFTINSAPRLAYCCHCTDCQKQASSAFGISVWFRADDFVLNSGSLSRWDTLADSGNVKECVFCPDCGTRIYHGDIEKFEIISVKGGTLDDIQRIRPIAHIWTRSALPWVRKNLVSEQCFDTVPQSFEALERQFQTP